MRKSSGEQGRCLTLQPPPQQPSSTHSVPTSRCPPASPWNTWPEGLPVEPAPPGNQKDQRPGSSPPPPADRNLEDVPAVSALRRDNAGRRVLRRSPSFPSRLSSSGSPVTCVTSFVPPFHSRLTPRPAGPFCLLLEETKYIRRS